MSESMMNQHGFVPAKSNASLQEGKSTSSLYNASANKGITQSGTYEDFVIFLNLAIFLIDFCLG